MTAGLVQPAVPPRPMTPEQIDAEVAAQVAALMALAPRLLPRCLYGEDTHTPIDAQIAVLRQRMTLSEVQAAYGDEGQDERDPHLHAAALTAWRWMSGLKHGEAGARPLPAID